MLTTAMVLENIIRNSPYISDALENNLINYCALARRLKPKVEKELLKKVTIGALIMALKRISKKIKPKLSFKKVTEEIPDLIVKSNLTEFTFSNSLNMIKNYQKLLSNLTDKNQFFLTFTQGIFETTVITGQELKEEIKVLFKNEVIILQYDHLSSITIKYSKEIIETPGFYAWILKTLAWEGVNVIEMVSTYREFTIILDNKNLEKAFSILKNLFQTKLTQ